MITEKTWAEFKDCGMLWCANRILHLFGWALVFEYEDDDTFRRVYPARVKFRGFAEEVETEGFKKVSSFVKKNIEELNIETSD